MSPQEPLTDVFHERAGGRWSRHEFPAGLQERVCDGGHILGGDLTFGGKSGEPPPVIQAPVASLIFYPFSNLEDLRAGLEEPADSSAMVATQIAACFNIHRWP